MRQLRCRSSLIFGRMFFRECHACGASYVSRFTSVSVFVSNFLAQDFLFFASDVLLASLLLSILLTVTFPKLFISCKSKRFSVRTYSLRSLLRAKYDTVDKGPGLCLAEGDSTMGNRYVYTPTLGLNRVSTNLSAPMLFITTEHGLSSSSLRTTFGIPHSLHNPQKESPCSPS